MFRSRRFLHRNDVCVCVEHYLFWHLRWIWLVKKFSIEMSTAWYGYCEAILCLRSYVYSIGQCPHSLYEYQRRIGPLRDLELLKITPQGLEFLPVSRWGRRSWISHHSTLLLHFNLVLLYRQPYTMSLYHACSLLGKSMHKYGNDYAAKLCLRQSLTLTGNNT